MRYDPYTGDPIPEDTNTTENQPLNNNENGFANENPSVNLDKDSISQENSPNAFDHDNTGAPSNPSFDHDNTGAPSNPSSDYASYNAGTDNMYHTSDPHYIPNQQNNYNNQGYSNTYTSDNQQYNPYTGQPMNSNYNNYNQNMDEEKNRKASVFSTISLICGIASILFSFASFCCCPFLSIILAIASIVFWAIGKDTYGRRNGLATAGLITSIVGILLTILFVIISFSYMGNLGSFYDEFQKDFNQPQNHSNNYNDYENDIYDYDDFYR